MSREPHLRVAVIDDHAVVREGTAAIIARQRDMEVCCIAASIAEFASAEQSTDVVLLDLHLADEIGFSLLQDYAARSDRQRLPAVVVLTAFDYAQYVRKALDLGAAGYVLKTAPIAELLETIRQVGRGGLSFGIRTSGDVVALSPRERDVVAAVVEGLSNDEIGSRLNLSSRTVESHLRRVFARLGVASRAELAVRAVREGWLSSPP